MDLSLGARLSMVGGLFGVGVLLAVVVFRKKLPEVGLIVDIFLGIAMVASVGLFLSGLIIGW